MSDDLAALRETVAETLRRIHFDGNGCGTNGSNACSVCYGPSPLNPDEIAEHVAAALAPHVTARPDEITDKMVRAASVAYVMAGGFAEGGNRLAVEGEAMRAALAAAVSHVTAQVEQRDAEIARLRKHNERMRAGLTEIYEMDVAVVSAVAAEAMRVEAVEASVRRWDATHEGCSVRPDDEGQPIYEREPR